MTLNTNQIVVHYYKWKRLSDLLFYNSYSQRFLSRFHNLYHLESHDLLYLSNDLKQLDKIQK